MTQIEIIRMATEVWGYSDWKGALLERLERFYQLAFAAGAAHEREACAKVCEEMWAGGYGPSAITAAIRSRCSHGSRGEK